jgi:hypothetical protein
MAQGVWKMTFTIPGRLSGLNEIINAARYNRFAGASQKKKMDELCMFWINAAKVPVYSKPVTIHFDWYEPNKRRDVGNIRSGEKFISDSLVYLGRIKNDTQEWVKGMSDNFYVDKKNPRIEVSIKVI